MHALLVTFRSTVPFDQLAQPFQDFADALGDVPGFVSKAWLHDDDLLGGFYLFADHESLDAYLGSPMVADLRATDGFEDFEVRTFAVIDGLSIRTGVRSETVNTGSIATRATEE